MLKLRDYQQHTATAIREAWNRTRSVLFVLATGGGKTVVFCQLIHEHTGAAAAVVHRREIVSQIACSLAALGVKHRIIAPAKTITLIRRKQLKRFGQSFVDPNALCGVISVQTLTSQSTHNNTAIQRWLKQVTLCVFDEGHHYVRSGFWARAVEAVDHAKILFATATPERADGRGLAAEADGFVEEMVEGPQTRELIDAGYLSPFTYRAPASDIDIANIPITAKGDIDTREFRKRVVKSHLVGDIIKHYQLYGGGQRAIVFASDVETSEEIAAAARAAGITALALSGKSEQGDRDRGLEDFERGAIQWLVNVDLFDEGFDVPAATVCIMARMTESLAKYLQMIGRVLRPVYTDGYDLATPEGRRAAIAAGPKPYGIVIDPVRNWERHLLPNWPRVWSLTGRERGTRTPRDTVAMRSCLVCTQPFEAFLMMCPYCGAPVEPAGRSTPEQVDGDLFELDQDALLAIFDAQRRAEMSPTEYAADQIARHIPAIGRPADMKRHQAACYRRRVLRELVGWWIGLQPPERTLQEKHRRFYHRFGIDIGTAFTLNTNDTDTLVDRISARFTEDMK